MCHILLWVFASADHAACHTLSQRTWLLNSNPSSWGMSELSGSGDFNEGFNPGRLKGRILLFQQLQVCKISRARSAYIDTTQTSWNSSKSDVLKLPTSWHLFHHRRSYWESKHSAQSPWVWAWADDNFSTTFIHSSGFFRVSTPSFLVDHFSKSSST